MQLCQDADYSSGSHIPQFAAFLLKPETDIKKEPDIRQTRTGTGYPYIVLDNTRQIVLPAIHTLTYLNKKCTRRAQTSADLEDPDFGLWTPGSEA